MDITKLDIGDTTVCEDEQLPEGWISITLDDTDMPGRVIADCGCMPFKDKSFEEVYAGCFLELEHNIKYLTGEVLKFHTKEFKEGVLQHFKELYRVLQPGGKATVSGCFSVEFYKTDGREETLLKTMEHTSLNRNLAYYAKVAMQVGFELDIDQWELYPEWKVSWYCDKLELRRI